MPRSIVGQVKLADRPRGIGECCAGRMNAKDHDLLRVVAAVRSSPPEGGKWLLKVLARDRQFLFGVYRRHMKAIGYLGTLDRVFGTPVTTRNWNTIAAIGQVLNRGAV